MRTPTPSDKHEKEPGRLYFDFMVKINKSHRSSPVIKLCIYAYGTQTVKQAIGAMAVQGLRELMTLDDVDRTP